MNALVSLCCLAAVGVVHAGWPVLRTYEGDCLKRVKMPVGGIGTGTISLSGRGSLVDWELANRPAKGFVPGSFKTWAPHFAIRCETAGGKKVARLLEGPIFPEEYEGWEGCPLPNHGFPRFAKATFKAAYPLAQVELSDPRVPVEVRLEAMNPLVPGDVSASGIPAIMLRWRIHNPGKEAVRVSVCGTIVDIDGVELWLGAAEGVGRQTSADNVREPGWNVSSDRYWRRFLGQGDVADSDPGEPYRMPVRQRCVSVEVLPGGDCAIPFFLGWRAPRRMAWARYDSTNEADVVGNRYAVEYPSAEAAARRLERELPELEGKTISFVRSVLSGPAPDVVKEAALFNIVALRSETCFMTADGHFFAWEGCRDDRGSCMGSCTHVWGYEHALVDLWPELARDMLDLQFGPALDQETGHMAFRIGLPLSQARGPGSVAAADGQMQCIVKAYEYCKKSGDDAWLAKTWPSIRKAMSFCWARGGWDGDCDGVMEGCQHNTMDVEYYGPNPQMEFLYLAALQAAGRMAAAMSDAAFARKCGDLFRAGGEWTEKNLFADGYYFHQIRTPAEPPARGLGVDSIPSDPNYQLGKGCLIDQLLGDYAARAVGLDPVADPGHARAALATVLGKCRREPDDDRFNPMRGYAMPGERSLRMAWYPEGGMPRSPFPYYVETMTGFEYVVAALQVMYGDPAGAERTVRDIRARYDGCKRNPFDEAECGHHYARAMAAWTVLKAWERLPVVRMTEDELRRSGFTVRLKVDFGGAADGEQLYSVGPLRVGFRRAGEDASLRNYDDGLGNYLRYRLPDGTCPVVEATICEKAGRVGVPLGVLGDPKGVHDVRVDYASGHFSIEVDGEHLDEDMPVPAHPVVWPAEAVESVSSPRVKEARFATPAVSPPPVFRPRPDSTPVARPIQHWTPDGFNTWVGDVVLGAWRGRLHVFYLHDRRHHNGGDRTGRHRFEHLSTEDLVHWVEHPTAVRLDNEFETCGTGTPFEWKGKYCLAYGLHTTRFVEESRTVNCRRTPPFAYSELSPLLPIGGTFAESEDGIHFRKSGVCLTFDQNPSIYNLPDGRFGMGGNRHLFVSSGRDPWGWQEVTKPKATGGDCPCPFEWNGHHYILQGFHWFDHSTNGVDYADWTATGDDIYDGLSVPMVAAWKGGRRIYAGWLRHCWGWGGWLVFRELVQYPDGKLGMKWVPEIAQPGEVRAYDVADASRPFAVRFRKGGQEIELRVDPAERRAQLATASHGQPAPRAMSLRENHEKFRPRDFRDKQGECMIDGDKPFAIENVRGLDGPYRVMTALHYDPKADTTIFDVEIAGQRTMILRRPGRYEYASGGSR